MTAAVGPRGRPPGSAPAAWPSLLAEMTGQLTAPVADAPLAALRDDGMSAEAVATALGRRCDGGSLREVLGDPG
ncbi:hypothetical protein AB0D29_36050 [Streptomyces sp. NPDC048424]|uniref:hypothetical protein n=1 Tax=Streptomyces sp. NPDC048424 TaxID=3155265 RepID=UPI00343D6D1D